MSLREIGKTRRRTRILDAARECIHLGGADNLSLKAIAKAAEVSVATLYNLFGSKDAILVALLLSSIESFQERRLASALSGDESPDRSDQLGSLSGIAIEEFAANEFFYRELLRTLNQMESRVHMNGVAGLCLDLGEPLVERMIAAGELTDVVSPRVLCHQIFMSFVHAIQLWSSGITTSEQLRSQIAHSRCLLLAGVATDSYRATLLARLSELDEEMLNFSVQQPVAPGGETSTAFSVPVNAADAPHVPGANR